MTNTQHAPAVPAADAGSGKTSTLEGSKGRETWGTTDGDGLVHLAIDELFGLVHGKAITIGEYAMWHKSTAAESSQWQWWFI